MSPLPPWETNIPRLFKALGREDLLKDPRFTGPSTLENKKERIAVIQEVFLTKGTEEWMKLLVEADVPCGPVNTLDKALADPQVAATDMVVTIEHRFRRADQTNREPHQNVRNTIGIENQIYLFPPLRGGAYRRNSIPAFGLLEGRYSTNCGRKKLYKDESFCPER